MSRSYKTSDMGEIKEKEEKDEGDKFVVTILLANEFPNLDA